MKKPIPPTPLAEALQAYIRRAGLVKRLDLADAVERWAEQVGPQIAAVTKAEAVTPDGILWVRVVTAPWANELSMMTPRILARLNGDRKGRIQGVRWVIGPIDRSQP